MNYFITAIGTDSGKTLASAIVAKALNADYWKPIQAGFPTDSDEIKSLTENSITIHKEGIILQKPASPQDAASEENIHLSISNFKIPDSANDLVIEGAGGMLVPINDNEVVIDLARKFKSEVILVSNLYLGSINHTLLTLEALKSRNINIKGIIFNGESNPSSEEIILKKAQVPQLLHIKKEENLSPETIEKYARLFKDRWNELGY